MSDLISKKCVPCEGGVPPLTKEEAKKFMTQVSQVWKLGEGKIFADFDLKDFKTAMTFLNEIAELAEAEGHHPDITIRYNKVHFDLSTHAIGGLSENDFILAAKIDQIHRDPA